jgi:biotin operon repressor
VARITARWLLREGIGELDLTMTEALVMLALLDHIGKDGIAWRSQKALAQDLRISRQWINEAQARLRDRGLLIEHEPGRQGRATRYRFGDTRTVEHVASGDRFTPSNLSSMRGKSNVIDMSSYLAGG